MSTAFRVMFALTAAVAFAALSAVGYSLTQLANAGADIRQLQGQVGRLHRTDSRLTAQVNGGHRDLITCGDLSSMYLQSYYIDNSGYLQSTPINLPRHCINR